MTKSPTPRTAATIRDVARAAGVSNGTVSKVLNKSGNIATETKEKVMAAVRDLNFRPNTLAKSLHTGLSGTVGLISNDSFGRFTMPIMEGLEGVLSGEGMGVFMANATDDPEREKDHLDQLLAKQIDGLVLTARRADRRPSVETEGIGLPVIYVFSQGEDPAALTLLPDDEGGAAIAVQHLIARGKKRIAHVSGPDNFEAVHLRENGWRRALVEAGLALGPVLHGPWSEVWGREAGAQIAAMPDRPDAVFCGNDIIARGVADALREAGLKIPDDVALVGFDNWNVMVDACRPPLTSVDMNLVALGAETGRLMARMIRGEKLSGTIRLPCTLVQRDST